MTRSTDWTPTLEDQYRLVLLTIVNGGLTKEQARDSAIAVLSGWPMQFWPDPRLLAAEAICRWFDGITEPDQPDSPIQEWDTEYQENFIRLLRRWREEACRS